MTEINEQQTLFVEHYVEVLNATEAARLSGYAHPNVQGPRLLKHPGVKAAIKTRMDEACALIGVNPQWVIKKIVDTILVCEASVKPKLNSKTGKPIKDEEGNPVYTRKDNELLTALKLLGQALGMFKETVHLTSEQSDYHERMAQARSLALVYDRDRNREVA